MVIGFDWPVKLGVLNSVYRQIIYVNGYSSLTLINRIFYYERITEYPVIGSQP